MYRFIHAVWNKPFIFFIGLFFILLHLLSRQPILVAQAQTLPSPILIVTSTSNPFTSYYNEILLNEGLNHFDTVDISQISASRLIGVDTVILGEMPLTDAQVSVLSTYVGNGGNLIAMRPDKKLAPLLGLTPLGPGAILSDGYIHIDTTKPPGAGLTSETLQFHTAADEYNLNGATAIATLFNAPSTNTTLPAATLKNVGGSGGSAAAFVYDLAKSVIYTRQGNPAWASQNRETTDERIQAVELFYPDWINLDKVAILQADEQQRLLVNLIYEMHADKKPLPRFWYLPFGKKAAIVMTGDDHAVKPATGATLVRFEDDLANSPAGCQASRWECVRSTSYIYPGTALSEADLKRYTDLGFDVSIHLNVVDSWTPAYMVENFRDNQLLYFRQFFPHLPAPSSTRIHGYGWPHFSSVPQALRANNIRLDTTYGYIPSAWVQNRPGFFTGSGFPMRFAGESGHTIDVYQAATQITDASGFSYPEVINTLLDRALGSDGFYSVITVLMHTDAPLINKAEYQRIIDVAKNRGVPVISSHQLLTWLDGRNASRFSQMRWENNTLNFTLSAAAGSTGLQAMLPLRIHDRALTTLTVNNTPLSFSNKTIKGIDYALFPAENGFYQATYTEATPTTSPTNTPTPIATAAPTPTTTFTPTSTPTPNPSPSPTLIPSSTPTPTPTLSAKGRISFRVREVDSSSETLGYLNAATAKLTDTSGNTVYQTKLSANIEGQDGWVHFENVDAGTYGILAYKSELSGIWKQIDCDGTGTTNDATIQSGNTDGLVAAWKNAIPVISGQITWCQDLGLGDPSLQNGEIKFRVREFTTRGAWTGKYINGATAKLTDVTGALVKQTQVSSSFGEQDGWVVFDRVPVGVYSIVIYFNNHVGYWRQTDCDGAGTVNDVTVQNDITEGKMAALQKDVEVVANQTTWCKDAGLKIP